MSILSILKSVFDFFFNSAKKQYDKLPADQKAALLNATVITQIVKETLEKGESDIKALISIKTGLPADAVNHLLVDLLKQFNVTTLAELQTLLKKAENTLQWNGILTTIASSISIFLSGGKFTWESLLIGLIQFAYKQFIK